MSETIHPLVAELQGLIAAIDDEEFDTQPELGAAWDAYLESDETDEAPGPLRAAYDAARMAAIARRDALMQHVVREDLPREWRLIEDGQYYGTFIGTRDEENAKRGLRVSLTKNSVTFHKLPNGKYGLLDWYPGAKTKRPRNGTTNDAADDDNGIDAELDVEDDDAEVGAAQDDSAATASTSADDDTL